MSSSILRCFAATSKFNRGNATFAPLAIQTASFATKKISNYTNDLILLKEFHDAATANADGCIHVDNANALVEKIKSMAVPGNEYPAGRKQIVAYARVEYQWAEGADNAFKKGITTWSGERRAVVAKMKKEMAEAK